MLVIGMIMISISCSQNSNSVVSNSDTTAVTASNEVVADSSATAGVAENSTSKVGNSTQIAEKSKVLIYYFHVTNRCASCKAIEEVTRKTLDTYFAKEVKSGQISLFILDVDKKENEKIAEKYQAFGSSLFVTRVLKGKESTADLTGDGFKYARNKQDKFIEILKNKLQEYLK